MLEALHLSPKSALTNSPLISAWSSLNLRSSILPLVTWESCTYHPKCINKLPLDQCMVFIGLEIFILSSRAASCPDLVLHTELNHLDGLVS
ncbi:hypothetical protein Hanom_Chr01g00086011 [Helianthus anomalus]